MPDTPTPETPAELAAECKRLAHDVCSSAAGYFTADDDLPELEAPYRAAQFALVAAIDRLATLAASSTAPEGEVTITTDESGRCVAVTRTDSEHRILSVIWKAAPAAAERKPLTDEQITAIWSEKPRWHAAPIGETDLEFARAIERAHGIPAAPAGSEEGRAA